jgi:hypothetical protein
LSVELDLRRALFEWWRWTVLGAACFNIAEKLEYRNGVQRWANLVATLALAGNKEAKAVSVVLTEALIASFPDEQQSLVKARVASGDMNLNPMTFKGQLRSVQKVIVLTASDSPTEDVYRVAASFEAVSLSKREKLKPFENLPRDFIPKLKLIFAFMEELRMILPGSYWL